MSERILKILDSLDQLERTYKAKKVITEEEELRSRLDLRFDFNMLASFLDTWYECLKGDLGDQFFKEKIDFLLQLAYFIWKKYMV